MPIRFESAPQPRQQQQEPRRGWRRKIATTILLTLLGMAITSPLFAMFIVEESIQLSGFGIFMSNSYKDYDEMQIALARYKNTLDTGKQIMSAPLPVVSLIQAYWLFLQSGYGYYDTTSKALAFKETQNATTPTYTHRCIMYHYEYKIEKIPENTQPAKLQELIDHYVQLGYHIKSSYVTSSGARGATWYIVYTFEKTTVTETIVPTDTACPVSN